MIVILSQLFCFVILVIPSAAEGDRTDDDVDNGML